jgi:putative transposase
MDCALASITRGRAVRAVCHAFSLTRSHVLAKIDRTSEWTDLRKSPPRNDDAVVKQAIANMVKDRATYGYRRVWACLRLEGHDRVNHKRIYRVMRDEG